MEKEESQMVIFDKDIVFQLNKKSEKYASHVPKTIYNLNSLLKKLSTDLGVTVEIAEPGIWKNFVFCKITSETFFDIGICK